MALSPIATQIVSLAPAVRHAKELLVRIFLPYIALLPIQTKSKLGLFRYTKVKIVRDLYVARYGIEKTARDFLSSIAIGAHETRTTVLQQKIIVS